MKKALLPLCAVMLLFSCTSYTTIRTLPDGVKVYRDDTLIGVTPYQYWDRKLSFFGTDLSLKKEGYKDKQVCIDKDCLYGYRIFLPPIISYPWLFGYEPEYLYEMEKQPQAQKGIYRQLIVE